MSVTVARLVAAGLLLTALGGCSSNDGTPAARVTFDQAEMTGRGEDPTTTFESRQARLSEMEELCAPDGR